MRTLAAFLSIASFAAPAAQAEPYALLGASSVEGLSMVDVASLDTEGPYRRAWAYVVLPERKPQRIYLEASELEFDCRKNRTRMVSGVRYGDRDQVVAKSSKVDAWRPVVAKTPGASMQRQVCLGQFDTERLRGHGKTVHQYAAEMRPLLARLP